MSGVVFVRFDAARPLSRQRAPVLERVLAQGAAPVESSDWRSEAFSAIAADGAPAPGVAAAALYASLGVVSGRWVCIASPVHLVAGMSNVTLPDGGILDLDRGEGLALAADFNRVFSGSGVRLLVGDSGILWCAFDQMLRVSTREPGAVIGNDVFGFQPTGADAARLRQVMSEIEMWLFDHAVNRMRSAQQRLAVTGLWLWGGGAMLSALPPVRGWTAGADPLFAVFGNTEAFADAAARERGAGVLVCAAQPGAAGWPRIEQQWLAPLAAALRSGGIERLKLSVADRLVIVDKRRNWRFWRRPRPWWETFELQGNEANGIQ